MASARRSRDLLLAEWPEAWRTWIDLGADADRLDLAPPGAANPPVVGVRSRRSTYERALRACRGRRRWAHRRGRPRRAASSSGRRGWWASSWTAPPIEADLVIDAGGRLSRLSPRARRISSGDTGMAYVTRTYRRRAATGLGPMTGPVAWTGIFDGYQVYVFPHEHGHFSVVIVRPTADVDLTLLRHLEAFDAACRAIPGLADWTDPALAAPTSGVLVGGSAPQRLPAPARPARPGGGG